MKIDRRFVGIAMSVLLAVSIAVPASAEGEAKKKPLTIKSPATFEKGVVLREAVKAECQLPTKLPAYIQDFAKKRSEVTLAEKIGESKGRTLSVVFEEVREAGTAGPKAVTVKGELRDGGKVVGTIRARRSTIGGPLGAFGGACGILHRCLKALGKDLAGWAEKPEMNVEMMN